MGSPKRRIWRKIHIGIDEETLKVRAVKVTIGNIGDATVLPERLNQIPADQVIGSVTADRPMTRANATRRLPPEMPTR
ncbi:MAG: hypothetical protein ACI92Z_003036 [Paracoccaceae bacterium]|jgi:hypothetical protein